jgi:hypothetical protein
MVSLSLVSIGSGSINSSKLSASYLEPRLKIAPSATSSSSSSDQVASTSEREKVNSRTSNLLLTSSIALQKRKDLTSSMLDTVNTVQDLLVQYSNEADPIKKELIGAEITNSLSSSNSEINTEISKDSTLSSNNNIKTVVSPGGDLKNSENTASIQIDKLSTYSDIGLSSIDLSDVESSYNKLEESKAILSSKISSYDSNLTSIGVEVKQQVSKFDASNKANSIDSKEDFASAISNSIKNLISEKPINNIDVEKLIDDNTKNESNTTSTSSLLSEDISA